MEICSVEQLYAACCTADRFYEAIELTIDAFPPEPPMTREALAQRMIHDMLMYWPPSGTC